MFSGNPPLIMRKRCQQYRARFNRGEAGPPRSHTLWDPHRHASRRVGVKLPIFDGPREDDLRNGKVDLADSAPTDTLIRKSLFPP